MGGVTCVLRRQAMTLSSPIPGNAALVPGLGAVTHGCVRVDGVQLHYVEAGAGPPVLLLHGFPEFWYSWRRQIPALAAAGFRPIALDLRGYNESDAPRGAWHYRV